VAGPHDHRAEAVEPSLADADRRPQQDLDRFSTSAELLDYIKTPAGTKFLESAPILCTPRRRAECAAEPGDVVGADRCGRRRGIGGPAAREQAFRQESAQELFALGMIGASIGIGFIVSAAVSIFLSRRLGLWQSPNAERADEVSAVR
jgi:hypothetical protein